MSETDKSELFVANPDSSYYGIINKPKVIKLSKGIKQLNLYVNGTKIATKKKG